MVPDEVLRRHFGEPTVQRAVGYVRAGNVLDCTDEVDADGYLDIRGTV